MSDCTRCAHNIGVAHDLDTARGKARRRARMAETTLETAAERIARNASAGDAATAEFIDLALEHLRSSVGHLAR